MCIASFVFPFFFFPLKIELIPKPAQPCDAPPLYLRLRMGKPLNRKGAMTTPIMSYGKKKMKPEYWFSIPRDKYVCAPLVAMTWNHL